MSWRPLIVACALAVGTASAQSTLPLAQDELLLNARVWEARDRGDLAKLALEKLVAARPDSPAALVELGELHLRMAEIPAAQRVLAELETRFPNSPEAKTFATELRFATRDRLALASVQRLIQVDRGADARSELNKLFPDGAPGGALGIEYFRLLASTPGGWEAALDGLRALTNRHAGDPRYEFALARHLLGREATELEGVRRLTALAERQDVRSREVDDPLARSLRELGFRRAPLDALRAYARRHPNDVDIHRIAEQRAQLETEREALLRTVDNAANAEQQRRRAIALQDALLATRAADTPAGAIAILRALRDANRAPIDRLDESTRAALMWARRSLMSGRNDSARADVEQEVAIAFARGENERVIPLLARLEEHVSADAALEALATASQLQPASTWLFETRVRWLSDHGRFDEALALLESRPIDARWTAVARDDLRANAFDRRAQAALDAGDEARALADLEQAIAAAPAYPWTRFRLAGLLANKGDRNRARTLMSEGAQLAPRNPEMRYAQALLLSSIDDAEAAFTALDSVPAGERTEPMQVLARRLQIDRARSEARRLFAAGDSAGAARSLRNVQSLASNELDLARQLADAWMDIDQSSVGLALFEPIATLSADNDVQLTWARLLNRANDPRMGEVLMRLQSAAQLSADQRAQIAALQRDAQQRSIRALQSDGDVDAAIERTDALLARTPNDRSLRVLRAELELASGRAQSARDRFAALVAEDPRDLDTRLAYVRALTDTGDVDLARAQVQTVVEQAPATAVELRLSLARRQLDLGDSVGARATLAALLEADPTRSDALLLAGRAELAQRDFVRAREFFSQASRSSDLGIGSEARLAREAIETRLLSWTEGGIELRHKPGDAGISQFDGWSVPTLWRYALDFERRLTLRADAVSIDSGTLGDDFDTAALLGTIQASGNSSRRFTNGSDSGVSLGLRYETDTLSAGIGTTPLGFLLTNIVGGFEWAPEWRELDLAFGVERRAVTSSVLSYAGMRDPISGREWGGVVDTGAYAEAGWYREFYSVSGALRYSQLSGEHVENNRFIGARVATDWKFWSRPQVRAFVGATINLWSYEHNLQNYTFGHGGYYSPESYVSFAIPVELQGTWRDMSFRVRLSASYSNSKIERAAFYPSDAALQAAAANSPLPSGFDAPIYTDHGGSGTSLSGYAAIEKQLTPAFVVGAKLDIDRADYYEPTVFMVYVRHVLGNATTPVNIPPRPIRLYNE